IENLQTASNEQGITLWQAACNAGSKATKIAAFVRLIEALRNQVGQMPLSEIIVGILKDSGLTEHYRTPKGDNQDRLDNLDELVNAAIEFKPEDSNFETLPENISDDPAFPILAFLSNAALESGENQAGAGEKAVQLMTVHASKGLEFNAVFLTGMEEGRFPSEMS
ncbi:3'-5' exonuclease, partial [Neisseria sp. P0021.S004]